MSSCFLLLLFSLKCPGFVNYVLMAISGNSSTDKTCCVLSVGLGALKYLSASPWAVFDADTLVGRPGFSPKPRGGERLRVASEFVAWCQADQ